MKRKDKVITILGISVLMCSLFLVTIPVTAIAAEQDDFVLDIYGNANEDDAIDMRDLTYVKLIFFGKKPETELADAKYDGKINPLDFIQIKLIIVGKEKEITIIDAIDRTVTVNKPVKRIIPLSDPYADALRVLGGENKAVGIGSGVASEKILLPVMCKLPTVGSIWGAGPDIEAILALNPDIIISYGQFPNPKLLEDKLSGTGIVVVRLDFSYPEGIIGNTKKLGYIIDKRNEADEFCDWVEGTMDTIKDLTKGLSDEDKPRVYGEMYPTPNNWRYKTNFGKGTSTAQQCKIAGGRNIAANVIGYDVDPEWVVEQNPDIIIATVTSTIPSGYGVDDWTGVKAVWETAMNLPELQNINAVKNERVYVVASDIRCGVQHVICTTYFAKWFHPELFKDLDPKALHQEYLDRFQRIDYDLDKRGVFVYPELE